MRIERLVSTCGVGQARQRIAAIQADLFPSTGVDGALSVTTGSFRWQPPRAAGTWAPAPCAPAPGGWGVGVIERRSGSCRPPGCPWQLAIGCGEVRVVACIISERRGLLLPLLLKA